MSPRRRAGCFRGCGSRGFGAAGRGGAAGSPATGSCGRTSAAALRGRRFGDGRFSDGGGGLRAAGAAADRLLNRRFSGLSRRRLCASAATGSAAASSAKAGSGSAGSATLRARERRAGALALASASGARSLCGLGGKSLRARRQLPVRGLGGCPSWEAALRRVRTGRLRRRGHSCFCCSAASLVTAESSLPATTWSLSICGDTPAPDVPPHPAPVGANICQHPQALTEVNWIPSGSHRQWGAAALEGRRNCSETR